MRCLRKLENALNNCWFCYYSPLKDTKMWCSLHLHATVSISIDLVMCVCVESCHSHQRLNMVGSLPKLEERRCQNDVFCDHTPLEETKHWGLQS
jgi:hypothetical protein